MKAKYLISNKEHRLFLAVAFAAFIFSISGYISYTVKADFERSEYFRIQEEKMARNELVFSGPYCHPDRHPQFLFSIVLLSGAVFLSLCFAKLYLFSFFFTIVSISRFIYRFFETGNEFFYDQLGILSGINRIFHYAGEFDLNIVVLFLLSILLFWQFSILLRILVKTFQKNKKLL